MSFDFSVFQSEQLDEDFVQWLISDQALDRLLQFARLRGYYENQSRPLALIGGDDAGGDNSRPYRQAQEYGLPSRITGVRYNFYGDLLRGELVRTAATWTRPGWKRPRRQCANWSTRCPPAIRWGCWSTPAAQW